LRPKRMHKGRGEKGGGLVEHAVLAYNAGEGNANVH